MFIYISLILIGLTDYYFEEIKKPKIIKNLLIDYPLIKFNNLGFEIVDNNKLVGKINHYQVYLSPNTSIEKKHKLSILIPLNYHTELEKHFSNFNDNFRITIENKFLFAECTLKEFDEKFSFESLIELLDNTTNELASKGINPL